MAISLNRPGKQIDSGGGGKTSKFVAVNPNECLFTFTRNDHDIEEIIDSSGSAAIVVSGDITTELAANDGIYFTSEKYSETETTIASYSYDSGDDETTIVTNLSYAGVDDTSSGQYINLIDGRPNYKIQVKLFHGVTHAPLVTIPGRQPFKNGTLEFDLSSFLNSQLQLEPAVDYTQVHSPNTNNSIPFYIKYQESYGSITNTEVNDHPNIFKAVGAAQQIGSEHGANMGEFVSFNYNLQEVKKGSWMTDFEQPVYWEGYPFGIGFCFEDEGAQNINMKRVESRRDINNTQINLTKVAMDISDMQYANHVHLAGNYSADVKFIDLWIETNFNIGYCGLLGTESVSAFLKQDWELDGSNNLLGVLVDKNSSLVDSINTRPDGTLYNPSGVAQATMQWDAVDGRYEPATGTHNINSAGWYVVINNIEVTMTATYSNEVCPLQQFYQVTDEPDPPAVNLAPTVSGLTITGDFYEYSTIEMSYTYADNEGDLQDTGSTVEEFYSYTDAAGTLGETLIGSSDTLALTTALAGKYIRAKVTPHALTGTSPGIEYVSDVFGPVVALDSFTFQTDFDPATDGTFAPSVTYGGSGSIYWEFEDASVETGATLSVTTGNGLDGTTQDVVIKVQTIEDITRFASSDQLIGSLDTSTLTGLTILSVPNNSLTSVTFASSQDFTNLSLAGNTSLTIAGSHFATPSFSSCDFDCAGITITGTFSLKAGSSFIELELNDVSSMTSCDLSNATFSGTGLKRLDVSGVSTLATLTLPSSSGGTVPELRVNDTAITSLDISGISVTAKLIFSDCTSLTSVTYGTQTGAITHILADGCTSLVGSQDISAWTYIPSNKMTYEDSPITDIDFPSTSTTMSDGMYLSGCNLATLTGLDGLTGLSDADNFVFDITDNALSVSEINTILVDFDTNASSGYTGRQILAAGTNAGPNSGPPNGSAAASSLVSKGFTGSVN